jgi:tetratricopeptide (TPR) repeat protein
MSSKRHYIALFFGVLFALLAVGSEPYYTERYTAANEAFKAGQYDTAQALYSEIVQNGMISPELFYNLGNTHFRNGNIPAAILFYERALRLSPMDEDTKYNLEIARSYITDKIEPVESVFFVRAWNGFARTFSADVWALIGILLLFLMAALLTAFFVGKNRQVRQLGLLGGIALLLSAGIVFALASRAESLLNEPAAIVFAPSVKVKSEPGLKGADQFVIHEGLKVEVLDEEGEWTRIKLADGNSGWLQSASIERI